MKSDLIIPIFGDAPFLEQTLSSLKKSDIKDINVFLVLDRASDYVKNLCKLFSETIPNVTLLVSPNPGIVPAMNLGIKSGNSELISRLDADDTVHPDRFTQQILHFEQNVDLVLLGTQVNFIDTSGLKIGKSKFPANDREIRKLLRYQNCIAHPTTMYRREYVEREAGYRSEFTGAEDYDLWIRLSNYGMLENLAIPLTDYRISSNQFSRTLESNQGAVETAVRIANLGYKLTINYQGAWPTKSELIFSNETNLEKIRQNSYKKFLWLKSVDSITKVISAKRNKTLVGKYLSTTFTLISENPLFLLHLIAYIRLKYKFINRRKSVD